MGVHLLERVRDFRLLLWGNGGANTGQLAYLRRHFHTEAVALRRHIALLACVAHRAKQVCQVSSLWVHLLREIIATIIGSYYGIMGANTGQLAYLRRHFHRKRWH
ncbi:hypothetical protein DPMN_092452 [Dreissena polymorpha]|uniref:Uncharacterized protein n=1 Tax=Dreissena polymorpha TaxID=45954 RepID=A0A9D4L3P2_DREPO|nr:hypothetical protein DPMN_092452 [Dreissena polymorpha]